MLTLLLLRSGTDEERRAIIQKLIEEKRKKQQPSAAAPSQVVAHSTGAPADDARQDTGGKRLDELLSGGSDALQQSYQRYRGLVNRNEAYIAVWSPGSAPPPSHSASVQSSSPVRENQAAAAAAAPVLNDTW